LPVNPFVFEVLDLVCKQKTNPKRIEALKYYEDNSIKSILIWNFDDSVLSMLPEGEVPYGDGERQQIFSGTLSDNIAREAAGGESATGQDLDGRNKTSLRKEWVNLYNFVQGGNPNINAMRREVMFINILQGLHPKEAELLVKVKDKKLTELYDISLENIKAAYPDIEWGNRS
tara:strand:+ start:269 stop:787 length:519 start_codon:yes stop_codon:yes gene_type:complete